MTLARHSGMGGFTLIELAVVMVLIAVVFAVTAPRLAGRTQAAKLRGAAFDLQALAASARARAVLGGAVVSVSIENDGSLLSLRALTEVESDVESETESEAESDEPPAALGPPRRLPAGIRASFAPRKDGEADRLDFRPDGSAVGGVLSLMPADGESLQLELHEPLGRLRPVPTETRS